jgi:CHAD domain-containing protein
MDDPLTGYAHGMPVHIELERKYELPPGTKLPSLARLSGVTASVGPHAERLEAVYYDTPDLRLAKVGVTLRKRTGGADAGWHLKAPTDADVREEIRFPLDNGSTAPPAELTALTLGLTRGLPVEPVARIVTNRAGWRLVGSSGTPLAELVDDRVEAENLTDHSADVRNWREVELEAADTDVLHRADKALRKAGLRPSPHDSKLAHVLRPDAADEIGATAGDHLVDYLRTQVDTLLRNDLLARRDTEDAVHQMRVAVRRIRGTLRVYRKLLDRARVRQFRDELQWLGRRLAPARDLEVLDERCQRAVHDLPPELVIGPVAARLTREFAPARADARRAVQRTLGTKRYLRLLDDLDRLRLYPPLRGRANRKARKELPRHVGRAHRKVTGRVHDIETAPDRDQALHNVRKAAKQLRYAAEVAVPAIGKPADRTRRRAKSVTKVLGEHQDTVVTRPMLRDLGVRAHLAGENGFTFGLLHGREQANAAEAQRRFDEVWSTKTPAWFG